MQTPPKQPRQLLMPRSGPVPALRAHSALECAQLDGWPAAEPVLGWLFGTDKRSDSGLLKELNQSRTQLRALSLLDVLDVLDQAGGGSPGQQARVRTLLEANA